MDIETWLSSIGASSSTNWQHISNKRKRHHLPAPPLMDDDDDPDDNIPQPPSPGKRRRYNDTRSRSARGRTASSIVSDLPNLVLGSMRRSSRFPQKALAALEVVNGGVVRRDFNPLFGIDIDDSKCSAHRNTYGPIPSTEQVSNILEAAANCERNSHHESSWNIEVHYRVLETALRFRSSNQPSTNLFAQPVNFMMVTTAGIAIGKPPLAPIQKIDFCLYIDPATVEGREHTDYITETIDAVCSTILDEHLSINHTDHFLLRRSPITVSIETKRSGVNWDEANLQIAVWQAAQWNFLRWMAQEDMDGDSSRVGDMRDETPDLGLEFLPGIVIMGHDWYLIATTTTNNN